MLRQIPVDEKKPSAFLFGVIRMSKTLFPETSDSLGKLKMKLEEIAIRPTQEKIEEIAKRLDQLAQIEVETEHQMSELESRKASPTTLAKQAALLLLPIMSILYGIFAISLFGLRMDTYVGWVILVLSLGAGILAGSFYFQFVRQRTQHTGEELMKLRKEIALLQADRERLRSEYDEYKTQLISHREELMLKSTEKEDR
jgi:hypothetical protein